MIRIPIHHFRFNFVWWFLSKVRIISPLVPPLGINQVDFFRHTAHSQCRWFGPWDAGHYLELCDDASLLGGPQSFAEITALGEGFGSGRFTGLSFEFVQRTATEFILGFCFKFLVDRLDRLFNRYLCLKVIQSTHLQWNVARLYCLRFYVCNTFDCVHSLIAARSCDILEEFRWLHKAR